MSSFLSHFEQQGISVLSYNLRDEDEKLRFFKKYLANKSVVITNGVNHIGSKLLYQIDIPNRENILNILKQIKDQNVFISIPTNEWITPISDDALMQRSKYFRDLFETIFKVSCDNNLSITFLTHTYQPPSYTESTMYVANFFASYKDETFHLYLRRDLI